MKDQNLYKLSLGSILVPGPVLAGGQFSILVLSLAPVMIPEFFAQNLQPMVQISTIRPQKWNWPKTGTVQHW
jgi:hypothetical protein